MENHFQAELREDMKNHFDRLEEKLVEMGEEIKSMKHRLLPEVCSKLDQLIDFSLELQQRRVPRLVYFTGDDVSLGKKLLTKLVPRMKALQLHLMCEDRSEFHLKQKNGRGKEPTSYLTVFQNVQ
ncbi:hypothetical protein O6H91_01G167300 [Diphasiastrum complanatum]|uniref:Uncharacterized protein n=1 Tax=Diphasiastrum complanatum TaxID=34168 RepID=A0ACC2EYJ7_DIPCM|nr:hypothetical protein O6H91_01G167300 [Diphasiastrum complanatum]